jgi:hypothetical protein
MPSGAILFREVKKLDEKAEMYKLKWNGIQYPPCPPLFSVSSVLNLAFRLGLKPEHRGKRRARRGAAGTLQNESSDATR